MDIHYKKYPEGYFGHWLSMFDIHQQDWLNQSVRNHIDMYNHMEGGEEYQPLCEEIRQIVSNDDLSLFIEYQNEHSFSRPHGTLKDLQRMVSLILTHNPRT